MVKYLNIKVKLSIDYSTFRIYCNNNPNSRKVVNIIDLKQSTLAETEHFVSKAGENPYRARQIRQWIFHRGVCDFGSMTDLSKSLRDRLAHIASVTCLKQIGKTESADGTIKLAFELSDSAIIESVWIPEEKRKTLCISTQAGCKMGCRFCLTGKSGFIRNLSAAEIVDQVICARKSVPGGRVTNLVLMGMGEPLDNYENTFKALKVITEPDAGLVGARKITLSTAGVVPGIMKIADDFPRVKLAVSINAPNDDLRNELMPINRKYPLARLQNALKTFPAPKGKRITLEYVMLKGVNDSENNAIELSEFAAKDFPAKINLIPFNPCPGAPFDRPDRPEIEKFRDILVNRGHNVFIRESRGNDILAACGQLSRSIGGRDTA